MKKTQKTDQPPSAKGGRRRRKMCLMREDTWQRLLAELQQYHARFGTSQVSREWPAHRLLAQRVVYLRRAKRLGMLTRQRIEELDKLGFVWDPQAKALREANFLKKVEELKAFKKKNGHTLVLATGSPELAAWVNSVRQQKKANRLSPKVMKILDAAGFCWDTRGPVAAANYLQRGMIALKQGRYDKATIDFLFATRADPDCAAAYYYRGQAYKKMGKDYEAEINLARARERGFKAR